MKRFTFPPFTVRKLQSIHCCTSYSIHQMIRLVTMETIKNRTFVHGFKLRKHCFQIAQTLTKMCIYSSKWSYLVAPPCLFVHFLQHYNFSLVVIWKSIAIHKTCETSTFSKCISRSNPFLEPTSTKQWGKVSCSCKPWESWLGSNSRLAFIHQLRVRVATYCAAAAACGCLTDMYC